MSDYYKMLSVARHATTSEIKAAYRALALQLHPDVTGNDASKAKRFQSISNAYNTLSNEEKRRSYDRLIGVQRVSPTSAHAANFYGARPRTTAYASTSSSSSSSSSSAQRRKTISPEHFNMAAWNAFHYGDNAVATPSVQRKSWMNMKDNAHQSYYARKAQRAREGHADMTKEAGSPKEPSKPPPKPNPKSDECVVS